MTAVLFQLKSAPSLPGGGSWSPVTLPATTNGNIVSVLLSATNSTAFFRLEQSQ